MFFLLFRSLSLHGALISRLVRPISHFGRLVAPFVFNRSRITELRR